MTRNVPVASADKVADYLVWFTQEHGDPLTNLKLQKLLYYAQGWYLALYGRPLFKDAIEAWVRGPVVRSVWKRYNSYKHTPITRRVARPELPALVTEHLKEILEVFGDYSAFTLERMTHEEPPWKNARDGLEAKDRSARPITVSDMHEYFSQLANDKNKEVPA